MKFFFKKGILFVGIGLLLLCLCSCQNKKDTAQSTDEPNVALQTSPNETASANTVSTSAAEVTNATEPPAESTSAPLFTLPEKKGDMVFTADVNDPFIQAIVTKYGVDPARLAGIYMNPASDSNYFWEFNGTVDANGKLIRNTSTLKYVYTVTADKSKVCRTAGLFGNDGLTAAQGYLVFETNKQLLLPKFEAQLAS